LLLKLFFKKIIIIQNRQFAKFNNIFRTCEFHQICVFFFAGNKASAPANKKKNNKTCPTTPKPTISAHCRHFGRKFPTMSESRSDRIFVG
jgi:hypothetical protein